MLFVRTATWSIVFCVFSLVVVTASDALRAQGDLSMEHMFTGPYANALWTQENLHRMRRANAIHLWGSGALIALTTALALILPPASLNSRRRSTIFLWSVAGF